MTNDQVHEALITWIRSVTNTTTIAAHQDGPEPAAPYIMVNFTGLNELRDHEQSVEYSSSRPDPDELTAVPVIDVEWRFSVHAYTDHGGQPTDILRPLRSAMHLEQVLEPLFPTLVLHDMSQIRSVPEFINERWEPRAQLDLFLRGVTRDGFVIDPIDDISVIVTRSGE